MLHHTPAFALPNCYPFIKLVASINQMNISAATLTDISELNKLINAAYRGEESKKGWTTEAAILDGLRIDEQALMALLNRPEVTILTYSNPNRELLGTVCLERKSPQLYLGMFAVSPAAQGNGIGKALLEEAEKFAAVNQCNRITLSVISSRSELIDWYRRHGYAPTGSDIAFEDIEGRFGEPKVPAIRLIEMEKLLDVSKVSQRCIKKV